MQQFLTTVLVDCEPALSALAGAGVSQAVSTMVLQEGAGLYEVCLLCLSRQSMTDIAIMLMQVIARSGKPKSKERSSAGYERQTTRTHSKFL